jgi:hypothetical protein
MEPNFAAPLPLTLTASFSLTRVPMQLLKIVPALLAGVVFLGCKSSGNKTPEADARPKRTVTATTLPRPGERPTVRPVQAVNGRIIAVRDNLRFVVIDFGAGKMPKLEQRLWAYRLDQKVAELKVSGPYLGTTVAADITAGEAREGDLVKEQ